MRYRIYLDVSQNCWSIDLVVRDRPPRTVAEARQVELPGEARLVLCNAWASRGGVAEVEASGFVVDAEGVCRFV